MRARCGVLVLACLLGTVVAADPSVAPAPSDEDPGTRTGTSEGSGSGGFELTLEKGADGALRGSVSVTGEPTYKATLKTVALEGAVLTATYDFTPDDWAESRSKRRSTGTPPAEPGCFVKASGSEAARGTCRSSGPNRLRQSPINGPFRNRD